MNEKTKKMSEMNEVLVMNEEGTVVLGIDESVKNSVECVVVPKGVVSIGEDAFEGCKALKKVVLPSSIKNIGNSAFYDCGKLEEINLPEGLEEVGDNAFQECTSLRSVELPKSVTTLGENAFYMCDEIRRLVIPASVSSIGEELLGLCPNLEWVEVEEGNKAFKSVDGALYDISGEVLYCVPAKSVRGKYVVPEGVKVIHNTAFSDCA
ncbi:MAG: leucine-rich repeat domain-containing protein, partial [Muribaculaceae bacterium]|nr:leucine-rich repeat domain-containing protein [Muribaculaceae bacterium]